VGSMPGAVQARRRGGGGSRASARPAGGEGTAAVSSGAGETGGTINGRRASAAMSGQPAAQQCRAGPRSVGGASCCSWQSAWGAMGGVTGAEGAQSADIANKAKTNAAIFATIAISADP